MSWWVLPFVAVVAAGGCAAHRTTAEYREVTRGALVEHQEAFEACGAIPAGQAVVLTSRVDRGTGVAVDIRVDEEKTTAPAELAQCYVYAMIGVGLAEPDLRHGYATLVWRSGS